MSQNRYHFWAGQTLKDKREKVAQMLADWRKERCLLVKQNQELEQLAKVMSEGIEWYSGIYDNDKLARDIKEHELYKKYCTQLNIESSKVYADT